MANNAANVTAGKPMIGGAVHVAPIGTTLPTTALATLNEAFLDIGYISADGISNDISRTSTSIRAWGGDEVLNIQNEKNDIWTFTGDRRSNYGNGKFQGIDELVMGIRYAAV